MLKKNAGGQKLYEKQDALSSGESFQKIGIL